ncbi:TIGR01621 family pseudouridine synthase [Pseudoalteromonas fenneropenaei]|uniref:TIGR01621 family pseudouridine synthase n=1 Tax=Pseudoalteromonas fenneropenaei TaxID=1737459 RepID=A0ABV7CHD7_9GAMM
MFEIVLHHHDFVVAYKPAGVSFHSETEAGFVVLLEAQLGIKLYAVHRLDKVTSGLIILATHSGAASMLTDMFSNRVIDKFYLALIDAKPKKKQGWVKGDMAKARRGAYKLLKTSDNPAITRFYSQSIAEGLRAVVLKPFSGKTHQLRVALKSLAAPILGDELYGGTQSDRVYLHAYALSLVWQGEQIQLQAPPVEGQWYRVYLQHQQAKQWQQPWLLEW